jgi:hypothetical protein
MIFGQGHFFVYFTSPFSVHVDGRAAAFSLFPKFREEEKFYTPTKAPESLAFTLDNFYGLLFRYECMTV